MKAPLIVACWGGLVILTVFSVYMVVNSIEQPLSTAAIAEQPPAKVLQIKGPIRIVMYDNCEYIIYGHRGGITHKGNCKNH